MRRHLLLPIIAILGIVGAAGCSSRTLPHAIRAEGADHTVCLFDDGTAILAPNAVPQTQPSLAGRLVRVPDEHLLEVVRDLQPETYRAEIDGGDRVYWADARFRISANGALAFGCVDLPAQDPAPRRTVYLLGRKGGGDTWTFEALPAMRFPAGLPQDGK